MTAAIVVTVLLLPFSLGCSSPQSTGDSEREQTLDRLRERMDDVDEVAQADPENDGEAPGQTQGETSQTQPVEQQIQQPGEELPSIVLEPRYFGALPDDDPRVLGVFPFRDDPHPIIDGDTVAVVGLDASLRLLGIDTEEKFRGRPELQARAYSDFDGYLAEIYGESDDCFPKFGTPVGEQAREFAREFFSGDTEVRLEYDDLDRRKGYFGRYLVYVFAMRDGEWVNYNIEAVRAGWTPYFPKYGYSLRFHDEFMEAEQEARREHRGIWNPDLRHYPDYLERYADCEWRDEGRLAWWYRRAEAIAYFQANHRDDPEYFDVGSESGWARLNDPANEYREINVFGTLGDFHYDWDPPRVMLSHQLGQNFALLGWDTDVFERYNLEQYKGEYIYIRGQLRFYNERPQFIINNGIRIWTEP